VGEEISEPAGGPIVKIWTPSASLWTIYAAATAAGTRANFCHREDWSLVMPNLIVKKSDAPMVDIQSEVFHTYNETECRVDELTQRLRNQLYGITKACQTRAT
jgi:hypothetical protein